ncbi:hypothetical protein D3C84_904260 [compost metagenome]
MKYAGVVNQCVQLRTAVLHRVNQVSQLFIARKVTLDEFDPAVFCQFLVQTVCRSTIAPGNQHPAARCHQTAGNHGTDALGSAGNQYCFAGNGKQSRNVIARHIPEFLIS